MKSIHTRNKNYKLLLCTCTIALLVFSNTGYTQGRVLINEYLSWPANSCSVTSEYIELFNFGPGPANIGCYVLTDGDYSITMPPNTIIQPGQYFVIAGQNLLPLGCANANSAVTVNLNWNTCNCTSSPIPATGDGLMTDGGSGSEQLVLFDASFKVVDAIVRDLSETSSPVTTSSVSGQCTSRTFDLDTMNIKYETVGESQGRANSFARRIDGGCGWLKDPQQSGGATNNTPGATSELDASLTITSPFTCTNTGGATVSVSSGNYSDIFPMKYILARDIDSNNVFNFSDSYVYGTDSSANTVPVVNLVPGIYKIAVETSSGCDLTAFTFNILGCNSPVLDITFSSFDAIAVGNNKIRLSWDVGQRETVKSFTIQKSTDGINYSNYSSIIDIQDPKFRASFFFEDNVTSNNGYYRIQLQTRDGKINFSPVKTVFGISTLVRGSVYPNPFVENFTVSIQAIMSGTVDVFLYDVFGRIVRTQQIKTHQGNNKVLVNTRSLQPGVYMVQWYDSSSPSYNSTRIVKSSR